MKIEFTSFPTDTNWVSGEIEDGKYSFGAKLFDEGSKYGIDGGRVSKLTIKDRRIEADETLHGMLDSGEYWNNVIVNYDRGWDIKPRTFEEQVIFENLMQFLENAPTRFESWDEELKRIVEFAGEGHDIAELSEISAREDSLEFFEAHEIYDIARANKHLFKYDEETQEVYLVKE